MKKYTQYDFLPNRRLCEDGIVLWKGPALKPEQKHTHDFVEISYIFSGSGKHIINGNTYSITSGDLLFINYNQTHSFELDENTIYCNILLLPEFVGHELMNSENAADILSLSLFSNSFDGISEISPIIHFDPPQSQKIEALIDEMIDEFDSKQLCYKSSLKSLITIFLIKVFRKMQNSDNDSNFNPHSKFKQEITLFLENNCYENISIKDLAEKYFYNPSYFSRLFKESFGKPFTEFIQEQRIIKAKELLENSSMSINKICEYVGYNDKTQFYKIFKIYSDNLLPSEYRKIYQQKNKQNLHNK